MIRIVGLSATLPNYLDIARFLRVNPYQGLFFFDGRFRPVPLLQTFIGIKTHNKIKQLKDMEEVCYEKILSNICKGYQVGSMSCVHVHVSVHVCACVYTCMHACVCASMHVCVSSYLTACLDKAVVVHFCICGVYLIKL